MAANAVEQHVKVTGLRWWREIGWRHVVGVVVIVVCVLPLLYAFSASLQGGRRFRTYSTCPLEEDFAPTTHYAPGT